MLLINLMDRNQATGLVLIFGILFVYFTFLAPKPSELPQTPVKAKQKKNQAVPAKRDADLARLQLQAVGVQDSALAIDTQSTFVETQKLEVRIQPVGARIVSVRLKGYKTWDGKPLELISPNRFEQKLEIPSGGKMLNISLLPFNLDRAASKMGKDSSVALFVCQIPGVGKVLQRFVFPGKGFVVRHEVRVEGLQLPEKASANYVLHFDANQLEKDLIQNRTTTCINYYAEEEGFNNLSETSTTEEKAEMTQPVRWVSFKQKFFNLGIIGDQAFSKTNIRQITQEADSLSVKKMEASLQVPISGGRMGFQYYLGPNNFRILKSVAPDYDKNVYLGWPIINLVNRFITVNVFYWLEGVISSYGIIIIILVLLIKVLLFPLSYKSYISMAKMKVLKPELDEIKERTGDDLQKAQAEQMKLYQQVGINPLSGCIPLLLQMPILLAVFNFFPNAIELRQESFWWAQDLSTYDSIATLPFSLPGYGDHVSLFTILMTASTLVLTWYNNQTSTVAGPMQSMSYIMPVVFMFILNSLPAGLSFYYLVSNLVSIVQQQVIKRFVDEKSLRTKLEQNKVKNANKKKTGFAARLEEAMRVAQETQKEKDNKKKGK
jgi:YidC/Oxa1 family membrane protein insertase